MYWYSSSFLLGLMEQVEHELLSVVSQIFLYLMIIQTEVFWQTFRVVPASITM